MAIVTRLGKGSKLTTEEMDNNLLSLETDISGNVSAITSKLDKGTYTGSAKDLENAITAAVTGASGISIVPTSPAPTGTGIASFTATQAGTYTNYGGVVVAANSFAIISRSAAGAFSISQTTFSIPTATGKIVTWSAGVYALGDQVNYLGKDWTANSATVAGDVPATSVKWTERLDGYVPFNENTFKSDSLIVADQTTNGTQSGEVIYATPFSSDGTITKIRLIPSTATLIINVVEWNGLLSTSYSKTIIKSYPIANLLVNVFNEIIVNIPVKKGQYLSADKLRYTSSNTTTSRYIIASNGSSYFGLAFGYDLFKIGIQKIVSNNEDLVYLKENSIGAIKTEGSIDIATTVTNIAQTTGKIIENTGYLTSMNLKMKNQVSNFNIYIITVDSLKVITNVKKYIISQSVAADEETTINFNFLKVIKGQYITISGGLAYYNVAGLLAPLVALSTIESSVGTTINLYGLKPSLTLNITNELSNNINTLGTISESYQDKNTIIPNNKTSEDVIHIIGYGQSLAKGHGTGSKLPYVKQTDRMIGYRYPGTYDKGAMFGITEATYNSNKDFYDDQVYKIKRYVDLDLNEYPFPSSPWSGNTIVMNEPPNFGFSEGLLKNYLNNGYKDMPFNAMMTNNAFGGASIQTLSKGSVYYAGIIKDITKAKSILDLKGFTYKVGCVFWLQGESNGDTILVYKTALNKLISDFNIDIKAITGQIEDIKLVTYQTASTSNCNSAISQFECAMENPNIILGTPCYNWEKSDGLHLTNLGSRKIGNAMGGRYYRYLNNISYRPFRPIAVLIDGDSIKLTFNRSLVEDVNNIYDPNVISTLTSTKGFYWMDGATNKITSVSITSDTEVILNCSVTPLISDIINYGFKTLGTKTLGGSIREKNKTIGYLNENVEYYMPVQEIRLSKSLYDI
jgi:hypothetical protein